jgi:hypothetical protein
MDAVSAGASVVAFLGLALQSAKTLHDVLSAVQDGPKQVHRAADALQRFQSTLQQLADCRMFCQQGSLSDRDSIRACSDHMKRYADKLVGLKISDDERRAGRYWKKMKTAFSDKTDRMSGEITEYASTLSLRLSTLQRCVPPRVSSISGPQC